MELGVHLVEGGLDVGQCGEDWIFVLMVDMDSWPFGGDTNASVGDRWLALALEHGQCLFIAVHFFEEGAGVTGGTAAASGTSR